MSIDTQNQQNRVVRVASTVTGLLVSALSLLIAASNSMLSLDRWANISVISSTHLVPGLVLLGLFACGIALMVWHGQPKLPPLSLKGLGKEFLSLLYLLGYTLIFPLVGWLWASIALVVTLPLLVGYRNPIGIALTAVITIGCVWAVFILGMGAPLP